jgi:hypothetical protein
MFMRTFDQRATSAVATDAALALRAGHYTDGCPRCAISRANSVVYADAHRDDLYTRDDDVPVATGQDRQLAAKHAWEVRPAPGCQRCGDRCI